MPDPNRVAQELFDGLPDRYDRLADVLSLGQNRRWRRAMCDRAVAALVAPGTDVAPGGANTGDAGHGSDTGDTAGGRPALLLDVASGTAGVAIQLASRSQGQVVGVDLTEAMLRRGRANVATAGLAGRVALAAGRAEQLPFGDGAFDGLTFTYLLRYVDDPQATLDELVRVVRPGGTVASLEFLVPSARFWRSWWWLYTRLVLPAAGWVTGGHEWWRVGRFLGPSITNHYRDHPLSWHVEAWQEAGLVDVGARVMSLGGGLVMWGTRPHG